MMTTIIKEAAISDAVKKVLKICFAKNTSNNPNIKLVVNFDEKNSKDWNNLICSILTEFTQQTDENIMPYFCEFVLVANHFKNEKCPSTNTRFFKTMDHFIKFSNMSKPLTNTVGIILSFGKLYTTIEHIHDESYIFYSITDDNEDYRCEYEYKYETADSTFTDPFGIGIDDRQCLISSY